MKSKYILLIFWNTILAKYGLAHDHPIPHTHTSWGADFSYGIFLYLAIALILVTYIGWSLLGKKDTGKCKLEKGLN